MNNIEFYKEETNEIDIKFEPYENKIPKNVNGVIADSQVKVKEEMGSIGSSFINPSKKEEVLYKNIEIYFKEEVEDDDNEDNLKTDQFDKHNSDLNDESQNSKSFDKGVHQSNHGVNQMEIVDTYNEGLPPHSESIFGESFVSSSSSSAMSAFDIILQERIKSQTNELSEFFCHSDTNNIFNCTFCEYKTDLKGNFQRHLIQHSDIKLFKCSDCSYECKQKSNLQAHVVIHSSAKNFSCEKCHYKTRWKKDLHRHLFTHTLTKKFKCPKCDYRTNEKSKLKSHDITHTNIKLFKCSYCGFECNKKGNLKVHLLTHSDKKLFQCLECGYGTNWKKDLIVHKLSHTDIKLFTCSECSYGTNWKKDLKKHLVIHTREKKMEEQIEENQKVKKEFEKGKGRTN